MIFTERKITVNKGKSTIDRPVILYRGDYEVEIRFTIVDNDFKYINGNNNNATEKASHAQLAILGPDGTNVFSDISVCMGGQVAFVLTKEMIDELREVGLYSFQIRLFDYYRESRVSIPPVEFGIEVREPVASEDHDNEVNNAIVGYSIAKVVDGLNEDVGDTFDDNGNYNKTDWETGDRISQGKLNKIEDAIDKINQNEKNDVAALDKRVTNNFNALNSMKADKNAVFSMANMGQDIKTAMTGGSVPVVGKNAILTENILDDQVTWPKRTPLGSTFKLAKGMNPIPNVSTANKTLTIYADTLISYGKDVWVVPTDTVIALVGDGVSENQKLWFNVKTKTFHVLYFRYVPEDYEHCILVCACKFTVYPYLMSCDFPYTIDNKDVYVNQKDIDKTITNTVNNTVNNNGVQAPPFMIPHANAELTDQLPIYDADNLTLTFPKNPKSGGTFSGFYIAGRKYEFVSTNDIIIDLTKPTSSATSLWLLLFNTTSTANDNTRFKLVTHDAKIDRSMYVEIGIVRYLGNTCRISLFCPYIQDGKLYGKFITADSVFDTSIMMIPSLNMSYYDQLPVFDPVALTLDFPKGKGSSTGLMINGVIREFVDAQSGFRFDLTKPNTNATSLWKIIIKPKTISMGNIEYKLIPWSQAVEKDYIAFGAVRYYTHKNSLSLAIPFIENGKLYNMNIPVSDIINDTDNKTAIVKSVNHRGHYSAPENTLSAYKASKQNGYSYVECDVSFTSDGVPVLLHDPTVDRTSNGTGNIRDMTFEEVRALDFGSWKDSKYAGEQIPTLREFLMLCKRLNLHPYIEIKAFYNGSIQLIIDEVIRAGLARNCTFVGFTLDKSIVEQLPYARIGLSVGAISQTHIDKMVEYKTDTNEVFIFYQSQLAEQAICESVLAAGLQLESWNALSKEDVIRDVEYGATGIINDNLDVPKLMREDFI